MGDMVGRVHLGRQDLSTLQVKKMKGLKGQPEFDAEDRADPALDESMDDEDVEEEDEDYGEEEE